MKTKNVPIGRTFRLHSTNEVFIKMDNNRGFVISPCEEFEDEQNTITEFLPDDMEEECSLCVVEG